MSRETVFKATATFTVLLMLTGLVLPIVQHQCIVGGLKGHNVPSGSSHGTSHATSNRVATVTHHEAGCPGAAHAARNASIAAHAVRAVSPMDAAMDSAVDSSTEVPQGQLLDDGTDSELCCLGDLVAMAPAVITQEAESVKSFVKASAHFASVHSDSARRLSMEALDESGRQFDQTRGVSRTILFRSLLV